jgi:6,7-dimethyl-8-ribityllumazine synthase
MVAHNNANKVIKPVPGARFLVVEARFYSDIADELLKGVRSALEEAKAQFDVLTVDGALEIPATVMIALDAAETAGKAYNGVVTLGCVVRGETGHYDIVAGESARALMDISVLRRIPLANGIITVENMEQAWERARTDRMNKGRGAVEAALAVLHIKQSFYTHSSN